MNIRKRKGISPLITTLLLIAIAVAASVLTYSWVMSMVGSQSAQAQTQVRAESISWKFTSSVLDSFAITVRNTGSVSTDIESISIRQNAAGSTTYSWKLALIDKGAIDVGGTYSYTVLKTKLTDPVAMPDTVVIYGASYVIRVTTKTGFYYEMVATTPSPPP